jgi:hypothetical protein
VFCVDVTFKKSDSAVHKKSKMTVKSCTFGTAHKKEIIEKLKFTHVIEGTI